MKTPWLDYMILISSILIFSHVKNSWIVNSLNCLCLLLYSFEAVQSTFLKAGTFYVSHFFILYLLRCRHWILTKKLHILIVAENTHVKMRQDIVRTEAFQSVPIVTFMHIAARNSLIISRSSIFFGKNIVNYVLSSLQTHFKRR